MAAILTTSIVSELTGLGRTLNFSKLFSTATTPTRSYYNYLVQAVADTEEQITFGDVATVKMLIIHCVSNDVDVDLDYVASFDTELTIEEGEVAVIPSPAGSVYIKNNDSSEQSTIEIFAAGT